MDEITRELIRSYIRASYHSRSCILQNMIKQIRLLKNESLIYQDKRNSYIIAVNELIKELNDSYNDLINSYKKKYYGIKPYETYECIVLKNQIDRLDIIYDMLNSNDSDTVNNYTNEDEYDLIKMKNSEFQKMYNEIDRKILSLMNMIGVNNIDDVFTLLIGKDYKMILQIDTNMTNLKDFIHCNRNDITLQELNKNIKNSYALINTLINTFHPTSVKLTDGNDTPCGKVIVNKVHVGNMFTNNVNVKGTRYNRNNYRKNHNKSKDKKKKTDNIDVNSINENINTDVLLDNYYGVTINLSNFSIVMYGYFDFDPINSIIQTSQVANSHINKKRKLLTNYVRKSDINVEESFIHKFITEMSIGDILFYTKHTIIDEIENWYNMYMYILNLNHMERIEKFKVSSLLVKFKIIKFLLMGTDGSKRHASIIHCASRDTTVNGVMVADIIYRGLNFTQQAILIDPTQYIEEDIERIKNTNMTSGNLRQQCIANDKMPDDIKKLILSRLDEENGSHGDKNKDRKYIDILMNYPWINNDYVDSFSMIKESERKDKLSEIRSMLDEHSYGQAQAKDNICDIVAKWMVNPLSNGKYYGFHGPHGVGKTLLAEILGKTLGLPVSVIKVGGTHDSSVINGHSYTYSGARPGLLITLMAKKGSPKHFFVIDEIDKTSKNHGTDDIQNAFIHAIDETTGTFNDEFFGDINFPINMATFIFTFNDKSKVHPILLNRMEVIKFNDYSVNEKITIAQQFLLPNACREVAINPNHVTMGNRVLTRLMDNYKCGAGVRKLKEKIKKCAEKLNVDRISHRGPYTSGKKVFTVRHPIRFTKDLISRYLGNPDIIHEKVHEYDSVGIVNGLYATESGTGGIVPILVYDLFDDGNGFKLKLTGKQGDTMQESVNFAWTIANITIKDEYVKKFYTKHTGLHIHTPDGGTPKDGPSAGSAFTVAFISKILNMKIKRKIAMTGEVNIGGKITRIGGLEQKLIGAKNAGADVVFVCIDNIEDIIRMETHALFYISNPYNYEGFKNSERLCDKKALVTTKLTIILVDTIFDILPYALIDDEYVKNEYRDEYNVEGKTCDISDYIIKN